MRARASKNAGPTRAPRGLVEDGWRRFLDALPVPAFITDPAGRVAHTNRALDELWGASPEARARLASWAASSRAIGGSGTPEEVELDADTGLRRAVLSFACPYQDRDGRVAGHLVVHVDVTERKRREDEERVLAQGGRILSASFEIERTLPQLAKLFASTFAAGAWVYVAAPSGLRLFASGARAGQPSAGVLDEASIDEVYRSRTPLLEAGAVIAVPLLARDATLGVLVFAAEPGRRYGDHDVALAERLAARAAAAIDRAHLYREAEQRAVAEEALRKAAGAVSRAYTIEGVIDQVADRAIEAIGADGAFVERIDIARDAVELVAASGIWKPDTGTRLPYEGSLAAEVIERGAPILLDYDVHVDSQLLRQMQQAHGPSAILVVPLRDSGEPIGCLILVRTRGRATFLPDEAARAQAFGELAALAFRKIHLLEEAERGRADLERVTESRNTLMRGFSHDLKNPLGAADGYLALLAEQFSEGLVEQQLDFVHRARGQLKAATELIEDLGELHRAEAGHVPLTWAPVEMIDLVRELGDAYRPQAELKGLALELVIPERVPVSSSDTSRARQILGNLVSNAIKYTHAGHVRVRIVVSDGERDGPDWVVVSVEDSGPGIPPDQQRVIFEEFARGRAHAERGAGLGLAISRRLAEALGGKITLESEEGAGSVFALWLPIVRAGAAAEPRDPPIHG